MALPLDDGLEAFSKPVASRINYYMLANYKKTEEEARWPHGAPRPRIERSGFGPWLGVELISLELIFF